MEMSLLMKILYDSLERIGSLNYFLWHSEVLRKQMDQSLSIYSGTSINGHLHTSVTS